MRINYICRRLFLISLCLLFWSIIFAKTQVVYYVSPNGNDNNPGTLLQPFATIGKARDIVRTINENMTGDIIINLTSGVYELSSTFYLLAKDSGTNGHKIIYQAYNQESPIISGGMIITDWLIHDSKKNIYKASIDRSIDTRQIWVNGWRAIRARSNDASGWIENGNGYDCPAIVSEWKNISNVEVVSHKSWKCHRGPIASVNNLHAVMAQPYWSNLHLQYDAPPVWIENAYELLDSEGEWYLDRSLGTIYYIPRKGEDMNKVSIVVPKLEVLVSGTNVSNIQFKGITFSNATWLSPNTSNGFACLQADVTSNKSQIPGNIIFDHSSNVCFENNVFKNLGSTALQFYKGCKNNIINNNIFTDISGSAISVGGVTDKIPSEEDLVEDNIVSNNLITKTAVEYEGCVGIFIGYTEHTTITHNELRNLPYTGISVGWGWSNSIISGKNNEISYNLIDSVVMILKDGGGIYTLSSQPGAKVHHNFINHQSHEQGALYPDEGSSNMQWHHNVVTNVNYWLFMWPESIQNIRVESNYYDTQKQRVKGTNCIIQNNFFIQDDRWPPKAKKIVKSSGREAIYKYK